MNIVNTSTKAVPIDSLTPHPDNPRVGNVAAIVESIQTNGFFGTVIVQKDKNVILAGTHRWKAAKEAGMTKIPVTFVDVDEAQAKRILLADNRTSDLAGYDDNVLANLLRDIGEPVGTGFTTTDVEDLLNSLLPPEPRPSVGLGTPTITFNLVFDNEEQQQTWYAFVRHLRSLYPDSETNAERLVAFIEEHAPGE